MRLISGHAEKTFWFVSVHGKIAPNGAGEVFFRLIQTLPIFWAERIWILIIFIFLDFLDPNFLDFPGPHISKFPDRGLGHSSAVA